MKKSIVAAIATVIVSTIATITATACPQWECQLGLDDYSCGGIHSSYTSYTNYTNYTNYTAYNETSVRQPIYCQYCGHESWDCICNSYSSSDSYDSSCYDDYSSDCDYNYAEESYCSDSSDSYSSYDCSGGSYAEMTHWANIRDCYGNIIGQAGCGDAVSIIGEESDTGRVIIYHYDSGIQGSVLAECIYGGYQWDGTGDNGAYNSYQGDACESWDSCDSENGSYGSYVDCDYSDSDYSAGSCGGSYQTCPIGGSGYYASYTEMISIFRQYMAGGYSGYNFSFGGCR